MASAVCLAKLLTRPDMEDFHLTDFMEWASVTIIRASEAALETGSDERLVIGAYQTLVEIFKHGHREQLLARIGIVGDCVVAANEARARNDPRLTMGSSSLRRKLTVKLAQRIGLQYLPPRILSWRYERGQRSLMENLERAAAATADAGTSDEGVVGGDTGSAASGQGGGGEKEGAGGEQEKEEDIDVPEEIEEMIEQLLCGLRDKDTAIRWSSAKGVGRVTGRLPYDLADEVVEEVMHLFSESEGDSAWHGGCLALAELARRGLLLPQRLEHVVPLVVRALTYDVRRGPHR
jgi:hypothetical protein